MVTTMQQRYTLPTPHQGVFFHVFVTHAETGKKAYIGCFHTEEEAKQHAIEAVGIEGIYDIHRSNSYDSARAKQEYKYKKFDKSGNLWDNLKPIRNIRKGGDTNG